MSGLPAAARPPLHIAFLTHSVNPRGGVVHTLELAQALHHAGHRVTVFVPAAPGERLFRRVPFVVESIDVPPANPTEVAAMVEARIAAFERHLALRLATGEQRFDVFHAQDPIGANALANLQDRGLLAGFVRTVHHLDDFTDARLMAWQQRGVERAAQVFCVSRLWQEVLGAAPFRVDAALVPNGVDCRRYHRGSAAAVAGAPRDWNADDPVEGTDHDDDSHSDSDHALLAGLGLRAGVAENEPVLLAVGGVEERKNSLRILQAFLRLRERWPRAQLVIAGGASLLNHDRYAALFRSTAAAAGLASAPGGSLLLTGALPDATLPALMRRADAVLMPSLREGFGLVVLEALACGTPVVVSRIPPFTEYLGDGDCCWADPTDVASIAEAMVAALDPARASELARALPEVCRRHDWHSSAERHLALYRSAVPAVASEQVALQ